MFRIRIAWVNDDGDIKVTHPESFSRHPYEEFMPAIIRGILHQQGICSPDWTAYTSWNSLPWITWYGEYSAEIDEEIQDSGIMDEWDKG